MVTPSLNIFTTLAKYNEWVNLAVWEVLDPIPDLCRKPNTTYYGSILGLLSHVTVSDITWLRRSGVEEPGRESPLALAFSSLADVPFPDIASWYEHRQELDRLIEAWVTDLNANDLNSEVTYRNSKGREFRQPLWHILLHMFNHQTHHRGQVAQVLDEHGIENDVSNLIWYLRE